MHTNSTKPARRKTVIAAYIFITGVSYLSLAVFEYFFAQLISARNNASNKDAVRIEQLRAEVEDKVYIEEARRLGYKSLLFPVIFDVGRYRDLASKYQIAPLAPQPNTDVYHCNEGYGQVRYKTDRFGFQNPNIAWDAKSIDIALIGDSFVQGACVGVDQNISAQIASSGFSVLNLGTAANSPIHYAAIAKIFGPAIKPKYLVVIFYANDNVAGETDSIFNTLYFLKGSPSYFKDASVTGPATLEISASLRSVYDESARLMVLGDEAVRDTRTFGSRLISAIIRYATLPHIRNELRKLPIWNASAELPYGSKLAIDTSIEVCKRHNCTPVFGYIPNSAFWRPDARSESYVALLNGYAHRQGANFINIAGSLKPLGLSAYAMKGPHLSPEGYNVAATAIMQHIEALNAK